MYVYSETARGPLNSMYEKHCMAQMYCTVWFSILSVSYEGFVESNQDGASIMSQTDIWP